MTFSVQCLKNEGCLSLNNHSSQSLEDFSWGGLHKLVFTKPGPTAKLVFVKGSIYNIQSFRSLD